MNDKVKKTEDYDLDMIRAEVVRRIMENKTPYIIKNGTEYDVHATSLHFICNYTDDEIDIISRYCLDLLEELRRINEKGYTRENLKDAENNVKAEDIHLFETFSIYETFATAKIEKIISNLGNITRVGGAHFMVLSRPTFISAVCSVFDLIIDEFNDAEKYFSALFMLVRMAMHMNCQEI